MAATHPVFRCATPLRCLCALLLLGLAAPLQAETEPLPSPLSLEQALALADEAHPQLEESRAGLAESQARQAMAEADDDVSLDLLGRLAMVEPSYVSNDPDANDSSVKLRLRKRLYDFGRTEAGIAAAGAGVEAGEWRLLDTRQQRRLEIMRRFYDVILADLAFARDNEAMANAYVRMDKAADRNELGQLSDIDYMQLEHVYQQARKQRFLSAAEQRATRSRLALALNRPRDLPADLVMPEADLARERPEYEELWPEVQAAHPLLKALRADLQAAQKRLEAARAGSRPVLSGELAAAAYNRNTSSTHPLSAGLELEVPLYRGARTDAAVAEARGGLRRKQAELARAELELRQQLLELWLRLENLNIRREAAEVQADYKNLYLDRSRALYELEVTTDLGPAMAETSAARLELKAAEFELAMAWAQLDALRGGLIGDGQSAPQPSQEETEQ